MIYMIYNFSFLTFCVCVCFFLFNTVLLRFTHLVVSSYTTFILTAMLSQMSIPHEFIPSPANEYLGYFPDFVVI